MNRVRGTRCDCGQPALKTGRCRSCAAKLANVTRKRQEFEAALHALREAEKTEADKYEAIFTAQQEYDAARTATRQASRRLELAAGALT